jgi:hypothetical protein
VKRLLGDLKVEIEFPKDGYFVDHDRIILFDIHQEQRFVKLILGQGLFGFDAACRRRSYGVWFDIDRAEFERVWSSS